MDRRKFLSLAAGAGAAACLDPLPALARDPERSLALDQRETKLVLVVFGGGTRSSETIADPEHRFVPRLWDELVPRGALFTNTRVECTVVHPNATASIVSGHTEWDHLDWSRPLAHPTIFEISRRARSAPDTKAWAFVYASILAKSAESLAADYGPAYAANVVEPPTIPRKTAEAMNLLMRRAAATGSHRAELEASEEAARLCRATSRIATGGLRSPQARQFVHSEFERWQHEEGSTSHDLFLTERAISCMQRFAPDVMMVAFGEIDCAHYGSWSRYVEAIRRTDELTWQLWRAAQALPEYRDRTLFVILPDHGRELDRPGHWGFIHHSDFYTGQGVDEGCLRVWMLLVGPGVRPGQRIDRPVPTMAAAATGLQHLGLEASPGAAESVMGLVA